MIILSNKKMEVVEEYLEVLINAVEPPPIYTEKPYRCFIHSSCKSLKFKDREKFRRHMNKHGIMIPHKIMKRKVVDFQGDEGIIVMKTFKRYDNNVNLYLLII